MLDSICEQERVDRDYLITKSRFNECMRGYLMMNHISMFDADRFDARSEHIVMWQASHGKLLSRTTNYGIRSSTNI